MIQEPTDDEQMLARSRPSPCYVIALLALPLAAAAQPGSTGLDFVPVGSPGNRATVSAETPWQPDVSIGSVAHEYSITRAEVTVAQWAVFANAYVTFHPELLEDVQLSGYAFIPTTDNRYVYPQVSANTPMDAGSRMIARYCNWLHNGMVNEAWAFESGAYDASTFTQNPDGTYNDQVEHAPGALFWIPTYDEWVKAAYYDPNKSGPGQDGYWLHPGRSDVPLISGLPQDGGQTNAGPFVEPLTVNMQVGMYPNAASAWGVLDVSGGVVELVAHPVAPMGPYLWAPHGSSIGWSSYELWDRLDSGSTGMDPLHSLVGFRVATIPQPPVHWLIAALLCACNRRRR